METRPSKPCEFWIYIDKLYDQSELSECLVWSRVVRWSGGKVVWWSIGPLVRCSGGQVVQVVQTVPVVPMVQVIRLVRVVRVVRVVSLDDMLSENIWFACLHALNQ